MIITSKWIIWKNIINFYRKTIIISFKIKLLNKMSRVLVISKVNFIKKMKQSKNQLTINFKN